MTCRYLGGPLNDPASWDGRVPETGDTVQIPAGATIEDADWSHKALASVEIIPDPEPSHIVEPI